MSLGGSALLNWLGRAGSGAAPIVARAAAISAPLDLTAAGRSIDHGANRVYAYTFLRTLNPKARTIASRFPGSLDPARLGRFTTLWAFDDAVTAPLHGFDGADDYWRRASSKPWLATIAVPTLVLNARNDPFIPASSLPGPDEVSAEVVLEQPEAGGHAGFVSGPVPGNHDWHTQRLLAWFARDPSSPPQRV